MSKLTEKQKLKRLIKECIRDIIFEEGFMSNLVTESIMGVVEVQGAQPVDNRNAYESRRQPEPERGQGPSRQVYKQFMNNQNVQADIERKRILGEMSSEMFNGVNVYEDVAPIKEAKKEPNSSKTGGVGFDQRFPGMSYDDPGVDISMFFPK